MMSLTLTGTNQNPKPWKGKYSKNMDCITFSSHVFFTRGAWKKKWSMFITVDLHLSAVLQKGSQALWSFPCYKTTACIRHFAGCDFIWNTCFLRQVIFQSISLHMSPLLFHVEIRQQPNCQLLCVARLAQLLFWMKNCRTLSARLKIIYLHTDFSLLQKSAVWAVFVFASQWCQLTHLVNRYRITDCNPQLVLLCLFGLWTEDWLLG